jgi:hypothetical protein
MNKTSYNAIVLLITFLLFGCATGTDTAPADSDQGLRQYLREAVTDDAQRESLHLLVRCTGEEGTRAAEVYGNGVGIWDFRRQFTLQPEEVASLIEILDEADFAGFAEIYGGRAALATQKRKEEPGACCPMQVVCNVELSFAGGTKRVAQLAKGDQSEQMRQLAEDLLDACEKPGKAGTTADDLTDALEKVAGGILAPETVRVLLHHKPEAVAAAGDAGFLLRVSGGIATSRSYDAEGRLQDAVSLRLSSAEIAALARELAGASLAKLPVNLFAPDYKDLSVEVLNYKQSVTARRFADMTPTTRAEFQAGFQRIYDFLYKLHAQVLSQGKPARDAG